MKPGSRYDVCSLIMLRQYFFISRTKFQFYVSSLQDAKVELILNAPVESLDPTNQTLTLDGYATPLKYNKMVVATGMR